MTSSEAIDVSDAQDGGILKVVKRLGPNPNDKPWKGDKVTVHYTGRLEDGTKFDSSVDRGEPFQFNMSKQEVIKGWDQGVASMAKGELAELKIKSQYGYGDSGSPPKIPGGATLIFEIELINFEGEDITKDQDKGITKRVLQEGNGFDRPNDGGLVTIDLRGYHAERVFDDRKDLTFVIGEGEDHDVPPGLEKALEKMKRDEKNYITIYPKYNFGKKGCPKFDIPSNDTTPLNYDVHVKSFERAKESWQMDGDQKIEQAKLYKDKGTAFFQINKIEMAANKYFKVIDLLEHELSLQGEKEAERKVLLQAGRMNLAMCKLKTKEWIEARDLCDKVIEENEEVAKAYYRRGEALIQLNEFEKAKEDFNTCLILDDSNKAAKNKVVQCVQLIKNRKDKEKKTYANMFQRFADIDAKKAQKKKMMEKPLEINEWSEGRKPDESLKVTGDIEMDLDLNAEMKSQEVS